MARIFLDANIFIDIIEERQSINLDQLKNHELVLVPLSVHLLTYLYKYKMPDKKLSDSLRRFILIPFNDFITHYALSGPTQDFEDNVQLHSAAEAECEIFLTSDEKLLKMKFFGKVRILAGLA